MKGGLWKHRRIELSIWIDRVNRLAATMSAAPSHRRTEESFQRSLEESDQLAEIMEQEGIRMPSISSIKKGIDDLNLTRKEWADDENESDDDNVDNDAAEEVLDELLEESTPVLTQKETFTTPPQKLPPKVTHRDEEEREQVGDYAESFASQRETAQLREEIEVMSTRFASLESTVSALLKEREALPGHLTTIREDINRQLTTVLERLNAALESDVPSTNVRAASTAILNLQQQSTEKLSAAADYATDRPREGSPIATRGAKLEGKRRFRPVK